MKEWMEEEERLRTAESAKFRFYHQSRRDKTARTAGVGLSSAGKPDRMICPPQQEAAPPPKTWDPDPTALHPGEVRPHLGCSTNDGWTRKHRRKTAKRPVSCRKRA